MSPLSFAYLFIFLLWLPSLAIRSHQVLGKGHAIPSRRRLFIQVMLMQALLAGFSLYVARVYRIPLFPAFELRLTAVGVALLVLVPMLATIPMRWRVMKPEMKRRLMASRPRSWSDMGGWTLISAAAGIGEEISYRGVLFSVLWYYTKSPWAAAIISAAAFGVAHMTQGWRAGVIIFIFALAAQWIAWLNGSLYAAMLLHFSYDVAAGYVYMRLTANDPEAQVA